MTTVTLMIQRYIVILVIFLCYAEAHEVKRGDVDCEKYPYHHSCRGMMTKRRFMSIDCDGINDADCLAYRNFLEKQRRIARLPLTRSGLWINLLGDDLQRDSAYAAYRPKYGAHHEKRKTEDPEFQYEDRRRPENFWQELEALEGGDY